MTAYRQYQPPELTKEPAVPERKHGKCRCCCKCVVRLLCLGAFIAAAILAYNLVQPDVKPCPANSPRILPQAIVLTTLDLLLDECTSVIGEVTGKDSEGLIVTIDRGEYKQTVKVIFPEDRRRGIPLRREVHIAGRIREHEEWGYAVHFGQDYGWWGNLRKNLPGDFFDPQSVP